MHISADTGRARVVPTWLTPVLAALVATVVFLLARGTLIDDAYITLDYARNVAFHWHWGLIDTTTANTATSPLNVLVLALVTAITRQPVVALGIVYVLATVAVEWGLRHAARTVGLPGWVGLAAAALVAVDPLLVSSIGMEVALGTGLIALLVAAAVRERPVWFGVLAGLLVLTRADLLIVVLVVFALRPGWWRGWWRSVLAALAVTLPWYLWSWVVLGSAVPDTLVIKTRQKSWGWWNFGNGPGLYQHMYPSATILSFLPAALGALAALCWLVLRLTRPTERVRLLDRFAALPLAGGVHYLAYSQLGVAPYHWYYGTSIACLTLYLAVVAGAVPVGSPVLVRWSGATVTAAVLVACVFGDSAAERAGYAPITTNWASAAQYQRVGGELGRLAGGRTIRSAGEIGALAYYCGCAMVDPFSDRGLVLHMISHMEAYESPLRRKVVAENFRFLNREQRPIRPDLVLEYSAVRPHHFMASWPVSSPWIDRGARHYLVLLHN
jgi:hypothetical protein